VVFADADLDAAVGAVVRALVQNAGQSCSAGTRLLVERTAFADVTGRVEQALRTLVLGPGIEDPDLGPLVSERQLDRALGMLDRAQERGASFVTGGGRARGRQLDHGYYLEPTLVVDVGTDHELWNQEVFGPVLCAVPFDDDDEAVRLANSSPFGLVAGLWTSDLSRGHRVARALRAGQVYVNAYGVGGGVELPFGGFGQSGYGRGKGLEALRTYTQVKNVCVAL
jgi:aldehyde dehydrogenase (NAD+)